MTHQTRTGLRELQRLDDAIYDVQQRVKGLEQRLAEVEQPAREMRLEERRVEMSGDEKRDRMKKLEDRLTQVRNVREETAVTHELDMVRAAREADEQEALTLLDQIRRLEDRLEEQSEALEAARDEVAPRREELEAERQEALEEEARLQEERDAFAETLEAREIRLYKAIRTGGRRAIAPLTQDGACGNCFTVIPPQVRTEILHGNELIRCEGCGVILVAPLPEDEGVGEAVEEDLEEDVGEEAPAEATAVAEAGEEDATA